MNQIQYYVKHVYGEPKMYVKDAGEAQRISAVTGTKTLTESDKKALEGIGLTFVQVLP